MARQTVKHRQQSRRVKQFIRRAEKRGYRFDTSFKESISSLSTQKLKTYTPEKLYSQATALSSGGIVSGIERRAEERRESARKAVETRQRNIWYNTPEGQAYLMQQQADILEKQAREYEQQMEIQRQRAEEFSEGTIILDRMYDRINSVDTVGAGYLTDLLTKDILTFGRENVARSLAQAPEEAIAQADIILYYPTTTTSKECNTAIEKLANLIRGYLPSEDEAKMDGEYMDMMGYED